MKIHSQPPEVDVGEVSSAGVGPEGRLNARRASVQLKYGVVGSVRQHAPGGWGTKKRKKEFIE